MHESREMSRLDYCKGVAICELDAWLRVVVVIFFV